METTNRERRRGRIQRTIADYEAKLASLDPARYQREVDYRKVRTLYEHRIAWGRRLLDSGGADNIRS